MLHTHMMHDMGFKWFYICQGDSTAWAINQYRQNIRLHCQTVIQLIKEEKIDNDALDRGVLQRMKLFLEIAEPLEEAYWISHEKSENKGEAVSLYLYGLLLPPFCMIQLTRILIPCYLTG